MIYTYLSTLVIKSWNISLNTLCQASDSKYTIAYKNVCTRLNLHFEIAKRVLSELLQSSHFLLFGYKTWSNLFSTIRPHLRSITHPKPEDKQQWNCQGIVSNWCHCVPLYYILIRWSLWFPISNNCNFCATWG
jgi:hypothetical protein